jgi:hypothetical protein
MGQGPNPDPTETAKPNKGGDHPNQDLAEESPVEEKRKRATPRQGARNDDNANSRPPMSQLNVRLPTELRKRAKLKAIQEEKDLRDVVVSLIEKWVE